MITPKIHRDLAFSPHARGALPSLDKGFLPDQSGEGFVGKFHNEVSALRKRRQSLSEKLAEYSKNQATEQEKKAIMEEYTLLQRSQKWLEYLAQSIQQTTQNIAANFR